MSSTLFRLAALLAAILLATAAHAANVMDLGPFVPIGINAGGTIAGDVLNPNDDDTPGHAAIWSSGALTPLPETLGTELSDAFAISDTGRVVGLEYVDASFVYAAYWDGVTGATRLPPLSEGFDFSLALDVDVAGNMVGVRSLSSGDHPYLGFYQPAGGSLAFVGLGDLPADAGSSRVGAISGDGTKMLGEISGAGDADGHYIWSTATPNAAGTKIDLTPARSPFQLLGASVYGLPLIQNSFARDGAVLGYRDSSGNRIHYLRTADGTETEIVGLSGHNAINDDHVVVGTIAVSTSPLILHAAKWDPITKTVTDLNTLLPEGSGWLLVIPTAIADNGDIAGVGVRDGVQSGFLLKAAALTAQVATSATRVRLDPEARLRVNVTLTNSTGQTLNGIAATGPVTFTGTGGVELVEPGFPPSLTLAPNESASIIYGFRPTQKGTVTITFPGFADATGTVQNDEGPVSTIELQVVDIGVDVTVTPVPLASDSNSASLGRVRIKVTDSTGEPIVGQRVRFKVPRWVGSQRDQTPALLVCDPQGQRIYPPGESEVLDIVRTANTDSAGELVYNVRLGTDRTTPASSQLLVLAEALDETGALLADGSAFVDIANPAPGTAPSGALRTNLDAQQVSQLPAGQKQSFAGVTGYGKPTDVLRKTILWLEGEREKGLTDLQNVDFAPIASTDGTSVGVLFFGRGRGRAVRQYLDGGPGPAPADTAVMLIELAEQDPFFRHSVHWGRPFQALDLWETSRPLNSGGGEDFSKPPRGRAVASPGIVTSDPHAFFGFPYPALSPSDGPYSGACLPVVNGVTVGLHSPVSLLVKDAAGNGAGFDAAGNYTNDGGAIAYSPGEPTFYVAPTGSYTADIVGTGSGRATIVMSAGGTIAKTIALKAKKGKTGTLTFDDTLASAQGTFNKRKLKVKTGVPIAVSGLKRKVKVSPGDELRFNVQDAFGAPVQGARVHATGKGFEANTVTGSDGSVAMPLLITKSTKLVLEISGPGLQTKKQKLAVKVRKP